MMKVKPMFAVVKTGGKQYKVSVGDVVIIERLQGSAGDTIVLDHVLMLGDGDKLEVGTPTLAGKGVTAEIIEQGRGDKVIVFKKKRRQNYRRKRGHRQDLTVLRITAIGSESGSAKKAAAPKKAEADAPAEAPAKEAAAKKAPAKKTAAKKAAPKKAE
jgi:large subunit ribosomal protein L21